MLKFNLLPFELREHFTFSQKTKKASFYIKIFIGLLGILSLFLVFALTYLEHQKEFFTSELKSVTSNPHHVEIEQIQAYIQKFNKKLGEISTVPLSKDWSSLLIEISALTPERVVLEKIAIEGVPPKERLVLEGNAAQSTDLKSFEKKLSASNYFTEVTSPLSNYEKDEDIEFKMSLEIKRLNETE